MKDTNEKNKTFKGLEGLLGITDHFGLKSPEGKGKLGALTELAGLYNRLLETSPLGAYALLQTMPQDMAKPFYAGVAQQLGRQMDGLQNSGKEFDMKGSKEYAALTMVYESVMKQAGYGSK